MTFESNCPYVDFDIRVTLALHHHNIILGHQILSLQQVNPQQPLQDEHCRC